MSNLIDLYKETTYPAGSIVTDMLLKISNCEDRNIKNGTIFRVTEVGLTCDYDTTCANDYFVNECCRREIRLESIEDNKRRRRVTAGCYCTLYTEDDKLIVRDDKYIQRTKRGSRVLYEQLN